QPFAGVWGVPRFLLAAAGGKEKEKKLKGEKSRSAEGGSPLPGSGVSPGSFSPPQAAKKRKRSLRVRKAGVQRAAALCRGLGCPQVPSRRRRRQRKGKEA